MLPPDPDTLRRALMAHQTPPRPHSAPCSRASPFTERDPWVDRVLGFEDLPADTQPSPRLRPYLRSSADTLMRMVDLAEVNSTDTLIDIGSGLGRAMWIAHF
ncbi:MAG: hypothetical protein R3B70_09250 [Polyangiaceae bacterium]